MVVFASKWSWNWKTATVLEASFEQESRCEKLGVGNITRQTVKDIHKENGFDSGPQRGKGTWDEFLKIHAETLWQCGFTSKKTWTLNGLIDMSLLVFIHIGTHRVCVVSEFLAHDHDERSHQGIGNVPISGMAKQNGKGNEIICRERLGGLLKLYERRAA